MLVCVCTCTKCVTCCVSMNTKKHYICYLPWNNKGQLMLTLVSMHPWICRPMCPVSEALDFPFTPLRTHYSPISYWVDTNIIITLHCRYCFAYYFGIDNMTLMFKNTEILLYVAVYNLSSATGLSGYDTFCLQNII